MCRACSDPSGGRRCPQTESAREAGKAASTRYYRRGKARLLIAQLADHGIRAMDDSAMPVTYHAPRSGEDLDLNRESTIGNAESAMPDKPQGALWTAPGRTDADGAVKSAWTDYDARESGTSRPVKEMYAVRAQPGAVIVSIETPEDAQALMDRYEARDALGGRSFDWAAMKRDGIDGVYASPDAVQGNLKHRGEAFGNLYAWDTSSVAWLSNEHLAADEEKVTAGKYTVTQSESEDDPEGVYAHREVSDEGMWEYTTPKTPEIEGAWDRVPKKVRESKAAERGLAPGTGTRAEGDSETGAEGEPGGSSRRSRRGVKVPKPKEYTEAVPPSYGGLLDAGREGVELLRVLMDKQGDGERRGQPSSR